MSLINTYKNKAYIIGEVGINHNGKLKNCIKIIKAASKCGINAIKFQNWKVDDFVSNKKQIYTYKSKGKVVKESFYKLCKRHELKKAWLKEINDCCKSQDIDFLSTPTSNQGVYELKKLGVKYIKNGSDYLTNTELLKYMACKFKTIIISTGMSWEKDIDLAIKAIKSQKKNNEIIVLHCTSIYPTANRDVNLRRMLAIKDKFKVDVGYSDHTLGWEVSFQAVTLGAKILEKHITLNHNHSGPDHWFSLNMEELKLYVEKIREAEINLFRFNIAPADGEKEVLKDQRLSIISKNYIEKGSRLKLEMVDFKKPGIGLSPNIIKNYLGKIIKKNILPNEIIKKKHFL